MKKTSNRGGKREGAGRKPLPLGQLKIKKRVSLSRNTVAGIEELAKSLELSFSEALEVALGKSS